MLNMTQLNLDNYTKYVPKNEQPIVKALLQDINRINKYLESVSEKYLWLSIETEHTEYSPERTDPCPDYFGYYRLHNSYDNDTIGIEMTYEDLDINLCTLLNFCEIFLKK